MSDAQPVSIIMVGANGRMGRTICAIANENPEKFKLVGAVDTKSGIENIHYAGCRTSTDLAEILDQASKSVIIDFSSAKNAMKTAALAAEKEFPLVIGATGIPEDEKMEIASLATVTPILMSANMSIGINVLARILPALAAALGADYDVEIMELHHRHKKDSPSGTALMLGDLLARAKDWKLEDVRVSCRDGIIGPRKDAEIGIQALRGGDVPGIHNIYFLGQGEFIEVGHCAESRENFARGALKAAAWLASKPAGPLYSMADVIWENK